MHGRFVIGATAAMLSAVVTVGMLAGPATAASTTRAATTTVASAKTTPLVQPDWVTTSTHTRKITGAQLPAAIVATLRSQNVSVAASASVYISELLNDQYRKCTDANNAGPTAGQNGDIVQLWGCFNDSTHHANQWWLPVVLPAPGGAVWTEVINWLYGKCLDARNNGGFVNGAQVQLFTCLNNPTANPNQYWDYGPLGSFTQLTSMWGDRSKVLDVNNAGPSAGANGDKIQVWQFLGGLNQMFLQ